MPKSTTRGRSLVIERSSVTKLPKSLINRVGQKKDAYIIMDELLDDGVRFGIGEQFSAIVAKGNCEPVKVFQLLFEADIPIQVKPAVLREALANEDCELVEWLLNDNTNLDTTDGILEAAASTRQGALLRRLSVYCGMEHPPSKWLDINRVHRAAEDGDIDTLKGLITQGINPDVCRHGGPTPLLRAVQSLYIGSYHVSQETIIKFLLSAGAAPNPSADPKPRLGSSYYTDPVADRRTPLFWSAANGDFDMVKLFVEAGASLRFHNMGGITAAIVAMQNQHMKVFRYLQQCEKNRYETGRVTPIVIEYELCCSPIEEGVQGFKQRSKDDCMNDYVLKPKKRSAQAQRRRGTKKRRAVNSEGNCHQIMQDTG